MNPEFRNSVGYMYDSTKCWPDSINVSKRVSIVH